MNLLAVWFCGLVVKAPNSIFPSVSSCPSAWNTAGVPCYRDIHCLYVLGHKAGLSEILCVSTEMVGRIKKKIAGKIKGWKLSEVARENTLNVF